MCVVAAGQVCDHRHRNRGREPAQPEPHPRLVWPCIPTGEGPMALLGPPNNPTEDGWWARAGCGHCGGSCSPPSPCRWPLWGLGPLQTAHPLATAALRASRSSTTSPGRSVSGCGGLGQGWGTRHGAGEVQAGLRVVQVMEKCWSHDVGQGWEMLGWGPGVGLSVGAGL